MELARVIEIKSRHSIQVIGKFEIDVKLKLIEFGPDSSIARFVEIFWISELSKDNPGRSVKENTDEKWLTVKE